MDKFSYIANAHGEYLEGLYQAYKENPESVDITWQKFFEGFDFYQTYNNGNGSGNGKAVALGTATENKEGVNASVSKEIQVRNLIMAYRTRGHLKSKTNPVRERKDRKPMLDLKDFDLQESDMDTVFEVGNEIGIGASPLRKILERLKQIYEGPIGFEYMYIREPEVLEWFKKKCEREYVNKNFSVDDKKRILSKLNEAVVFENFLHTKDGSQ
jgi:2-oxoglutarate dehydrogenase E1 component